MKHIEDYIIDEVIDCLRQSKVIHLEITGLDSEFEIIKKTKINECAITRKIDKCINLLKNKN